MPRIYMKEAINMADYPAMSVLKLSKKYSAERLETACELALEHVSVPRYSHLRAILAAGQDVEYKNSKKQENESSPVGFVRGAAYYGDAERHNRFCKSTLAYTPHTIGLDSVFMTGSSPFSCFDEFCKIIRKNAVYPLTAQS